MKLHNRNVIRLLVVTMLAALLTPVQSALSNDTVTKTFTVRGANNALLSGALVSIEYFDVVTGASVRPTPTATDANGVATVTVNKSAQKMSYLIFPAAGDVTNAPFSSFGISTDANESFDIRLEAANLVIDVQSSSGTSAPPGAVVTFPVGDGGQINYVRPIRSGAFGIRLSTNLNPANSYQIGLLQYANQWAPGEFSFRYGLKAEGTSGNLTYKVYTNTTYTTLLTPTNNVYVLKYDGFNVKGTLKNADGSAFILPNNVMANVSLRPATGASAIDDSSGHPINPTGQQMEWFGRVKGASTTKYIMAFSFNGSATVPAFFTYIYKNSAGGFSTTENGTYTTAPHNLEVRFPSATPNFAMKYYNAGTTTPVGYSYWIEEIKTENNNTSYTFLFSGGGGTTSDLLLSLPNGTYKLQLQTYEGVLNSYFLTVANGVSSLKNAVNATVAKPADGVYILSPTGNNTKVKAVNSSGTAINDACVEIFNGADGKNGTAYFKCTGNSTADFALPDGAFLARVSGGNQWMNYRDTSFVINVQNGVATSPTITKDNAGVFNAPLNEKNFKFILLEPTGTTPIRGWINYCEYDAANNKESNCGGEPVNQNGEGGAYLPPSKTYRVTYNLPGSSSYTPSRYTATVAANGAVTLSPSATTNNGRFELRPSTANVTGSLLVGGNPLTFTGNQGVNLNVQKKDQYGNWNWTNMHSWRNSATYAFNFTESGEYRILANPQGYTDYAWSYSSVFYVTAAGKFSLTSIDDNAAKNSLTGADALNITVRASNVKFEIIDKRSNEAMKYGWAAILKKETNNRETWIMNADLNSNNPGKASAYLENGDYRVELNPFYNGSSIAGLTKKNYDLNVNGNTVTLSYKGAPVTAGNDGRFVVWPSSANVTAKITDKQGVPLVPGQDQWVNVNIQKFNTANGRWDGTNNWSNTDKDGFINMTVDTAGTYRLRIQPNGYANSSITHTDSFVVEAGKEADFNKAFGEIKTSSPSIKVKMVLPNSTTAIQYANIEVRKDNNWIEWAWSGPSGIANITFAEEGSYQLVAHPRQEDLAQGATRKSYEVVATKNSAGEIIGTISALTAADSVYALALGTGNVQGTIYAPGGNTTPIANAQVVAVNTTTNQEMWDYSTNTSANGKFSMNLPAGTYKLIARAPWGTSLYGNSDAIGTLTVTANSVVVSDAFASMTALTLTMNLKEPTWKGTIKNPAGDAVIPYANICLYDRDKWNCTTANENGVWALSAPADFSTFSQNSFIEISDVRNRAYPNIRKNGATEVQNFIGLGGSSQVNGVTSLTLVHQFALPNFKVTVTAGNTPRANVWVSIDRPNVGWLGGNSTDANGVASFILTDITQPINVRAEFNGNRELSGVYAPTYKEFTTANLQAATSNSVVSLTLPLATPNFVGKVTESSSNLTPVQWSWVELIDDATDRWKSGSNTDDQGNFAMNIEKPSAGEPFQYTLIVNPAWNSNGTSSRRTYTLTINSAGEVTLKDKYTGVAVGTTTSAGRTYHPLTLGTPTVSGTVVSGSGNSEVGVRDSWVVPISVATGEWMWQQGVNSKTNGAFGLGLPDGTYKIQAEVPWNYTDLTRSAQCSVSVSNGKVVSQAGGCVQNNGSLKLALREPNLKMKLVQNGAAVPYAHVGIGVGNWYSWAQSNAQGNVSLFVDRAAILAANPDITGSVTRKIRVWVDPPYGNSNMVRWECESGQSKPICSNLDDFNSAADYTMTNLETVTVLGPNLKFKINQPGNSTAVGAGAWVALLSFVPGVSCCNWVSGANTDSLGFVSFNVDTSTVAANVRFKVEVNPRWEDRTIHSRAEHDNSGNGFTVDELNAPNRAFALLSPNILVELRASDNSANKWGWFGVEEIQRSDNAWIKWVGGFGVDTAGKAAVTLSANKRYRFVAYPGGGKSGTRTTCVVDTDSSTALSIVAGLCGSAGTATIGSNSFGAANGITIKLNAGNVVGTVKASGVAVAGAIVYANTVGAQNQDNAVTTSTNSSGVFGLILDPAKGQWQISIFPVNKPGGAALPTKVLNPITAPSLSGFSDLGDISLVP